MAIWARVQDIKARRGERLNAEQIKDLELAASFVRSIETGDVRTDVEIGEVAARLQQLASQVTAKSHIPDQPSLSQSEARE